MLRLPYRLFTQMCDHAREGGEREVCGVLIGVPADGLAQHIVAGHNVAREPHSLFLLDAGSLLRADGEARAQGWEIVGFYHSHPNHPPFPSSTDRAALWPALPMLIIAVGSSGTAVCGWQQSEAALRPCLLQIEA